MKKRVLQLIGSFHQGGSERQAVSLTRLLHDDGSFEIYAATLNRSGVLLPEMESIGLPEIAEFSLTSFYNANFIKQVRRCERYIRENNIDLVHTHDFYTNIFGMAAATLAGVKARIVSKRETGAMRSRAQQFVETIAFDRASAIVVNAAAVRDHLTQRALPSEKITIIYNGIDVTRFAPDNSDRAAIAAKFVLPKDVNIRFVTMVANLRHAVKNVPMLLRTAKHIQRTDPAVHFIVAGEGELRETLQHAATELGVEETVHFIGHCTDVPAMLSLSDACVLTSTAEGFSNSTLEYMAAGKPVVATNVGGAAEAVVEGQTGNLVASDDDEAMAARLMDLLADDKKRAAFGSAGKRIVQEKFSQETQLSRTVELYESLLSSVR